MGRHSEPSSPERESSKPDTSHPEHAKYSQEQEANWRQQSRDRSAAGPVDPQQLGPDGRISWLRQSEQALAQNSDYGNRADAKPRSERGWDPNSVQEREAPPSHRSKGGHAWHGQEKADSDRTQSSRGTTRSGSPPQSYRRPGDRALQVITASCMYHHDPLRPCHIPSPSLNVQSLSSALHILLQSLITFGAKCTIAEPAKPPALFACLLLMVSASEFIYFGSYEAGVPDLQHASACVLAV